MQSIRLLEKNEYLGKSLRDEFGVDADYRYFYKSRNYVFYKKDNKKIFIVDIIHEREDFMRKLFKEN